MELSDTKIYKYLGMTMNNKGDLNDHIGIIKGKMEAAFQNILSLAGNQEFNNIRMEVIWKLVNTCIIPIITYGAETWILKDKETERLQQILDNVLKRILKTPKSTPSEIIAAETGIWSMKLQIWKKQLMYLHRIENKKRGTLVHRIMTNPENPWMIQMRKITTECNIPMEEMEKRSTPQMKSMVTLKLNEHHENNINKSAETKSKVPHYTSLKKTKQRSLKPEYMYKLPRPKCSNIFKVRSIMIAVRANFKSNQ
jgi:hypothetical protein